MILGHCDKNVPLTNLRAKTKLRFEHLRLNDLSQKVSTNNTN